MEVYKKMKRTLLVVISIFTLCSSGLQATQTQSWGWGKIAAVTLAGYFGMQMLTPSPQPAYYPPKPHSPSLVGKVGSGINTVNTGVNLVFKSGILLAGLYLFDRYFLDGKILKKIDEAKDEIKEHVTTKITELREYFTGEIDDVRNDLDDIKGRIDSIDKTTSSTNKIVKKMEKKK